MFLNKFESFNRICIQCHDSPDADTLGAGFALYTYFKEKGKMVRLIYSGVNRITKPALKVMTNQLEIPVEYVEKLPDCDLLLTVDCQYAGGNVTVFPAKKIAMIDHHSVCVPCDEWCYIYTGLGSCSTVVFMLLNEVGYDVNSNCNVATALYYGLYSDTGQLSEIYHEEDKKMRDSLLVNREIIETMVSSNLSQRELHIAGEALTKYFHDCECRFALVRTKPCDPNLLGLISDLVSQVDTVDSVVVYNETSIGYKFSLRSTKKDKNASDGAILISEKVGSGGGHANKAGGMIMKKMYEEQYGDKPIELFFKEKMRQFLKEE